MRDKGIQPGGLIPSNDVLTSYGVGCRMAYAVMLMSRDELIAMHGRVEHKHVDEMMASMMSTAEGLKAIAFMAEAALTRVLAAAAAHEKAKGRKACKPRCA